MSRRGLGVSKTRCSSAGLDVVKGRSTIFSARGHYSSCGQIEVSMSCTKSLLLVTVLTLVLAACGSGGDSEIESSPQKVSDRWWLGDRQPPTTPTDLVATVAGTTINLRWTPSSDNVGVSRYVVRRNSIQVATPTTASYTDSGLSSATMYSYTVAARDAAGNVSAESVAVGTTTGNSTDTIAPTVPTELSAIAASSSQIDLSWTASTDNVGVTGYLVERCQGVGCTSFAQIGTVAGTVTTYSDRIGLSALLSYAYRVRATDAAPNIGPYSIAASTTTPPVTSRLVAAYAFNEGAGTTVADGSGNGNTGTISGAGWIATGKFGSALAFNGASARVTVSDAASLQLTTGMTLEAWVFPTATPTGWRQVVGKNVDAYYLTASSSQANRPAVGGTWIAGNQNTFGTSVLPVNTWTHLAATFDGSTVRLFVNGSQVASQAQTTPLATTNGTLQIGGDSFPNEYFAGYIDEVRVYSSALSAAEIQTDMNTAIGSPPTPDLTPPSAPGSVSATALSASQIDLAWTVSSDNVGVTGYVVKRNGAQVGTPTTQSYSDTGLVSETTYSYTVSARDAAGNVSAESAVVSATTGSLTDTTPPSTPTSVVATAVGATTINLTWNVSTDNVRVTGYVVKRNGMQVGTPAAASYSDTGLQSGLRYTYTVAARDAAGNVSLDSASSSAVPANALFPLHTEAGKRYLVDASGQPFLLHADTAWSLIADLSNADAELYLDDRRQRGFNAIIINLLEHKFATNAPRNFYNDPPFDGAVPPFTGPSDYSRPNEAYFAHADQIIQMAAAKGILVLLTPSYLGSLGGNEGWYQEMVANGTTKLSAYGNYLGQRYKNFSNVLWVHGGDYNPPDKTLTRAIALGIMNVPGTQALHTAHCKAGSSALAYWRGEPWLQVNSLYTYNSLPANSQDAYQDASLMPFFLIESLYENEQMPDGNEQHVRVQAYQALLSGAMGQAFGNNPIWHFNGPGVFPNGTPATWQGWLPSPGAQSMVNVRSLFSQREWWKLVPDFSNTLLTNGFAGSGTQYDLAVGAKASDGSFAVVYLPKTRTVTVNLNKLTGPRVNARWYDPASGNFSAVAITGSPFLASSGSQVLTAPAGTNASTSGSYSDWVLVLESAP
jgi:chitodextrinase